jgi:hypothetical protein
MIPIALLVFLLCLHFVADFILQSDWMATGKSRRFGFNDRMLAHIMAYFCCILIPALLLANPQQWLLWAGLNAFLHFCTDAITSNITSYLWKKGDRHNFFAVIGLDQLIHVLCLVFTWSWLLS